MVFIWGMGSKKGSCTHRKLLPRWLTFQKSRICQIFHGKNILETMVASPLKSGTDLAFFILIWILKAVSAHPEDVQKWDTPDIQ
jgi:hypothetical protein